MSRWICPALALLGACGSFAKETASLPPPTAVAAAAAVDAGANVRWQRSLADAEQLARQHGRPLLLALNMDGESASDRIWFENYRDPVFVQASHRCVCVVGSVFRHNAVDHDRDGRRVECPRFPGITCGEHIALEPEMYARHLADGERVAPRHALVRADGGKAFDLSLCFDLDDVTRALVAAAPDQPAWRADGAAPTRRDAAGRAALERELATTADGEALRDRLAALATSGDEGSRDALRAALARVPTLTANAAAHVVQQLQRTPGCGGLAMERARRVLAPGDLGVPPDFAALLDAHDGRGTDDRRWLAAEAAVHGDAPTALAAAIRRAFRDVAVAAPDAYRDLTFAVAAATENDGPARLAAAAALARAEAVLPRPGFVRRDPPPAEALYARLQELDAQLARTPDDAQALAEAGIASLDLGRLQEASPTAQTALLLEDAAKYLDRALALDGQRLPWWIERARAAYQLQRFADQHRAAARALQAAGYRWPLHADERARLLQDPLGLDALRWLGDADARLLAAELPSDAAVGVQAIHTALLALALPAISPFGRGREWVSLASFAGSLGLWREELALLLHAQTRLPADAEVRQAVYGALWRADLWAEAPRLAERGMGRDADARWWAGHAHVLVAEELRRRERPAEALAHYAAAEPHFAAAKQANPDYAASADSFVALTRLGRGHACVQGPQADRRAAAAHLLDAVRTGLDLAALRDGLGYDALDLVDKVLEWRQAGPSPVDGGELLARVVEAAATPTPFWASAVGDSLLREALRADGRNPERVEAETVDAGGKPIRALMGLPTALGDRYISGALAAGERAVAMPTAQDLDRRMCAQALLIAAERELARGRTNGVAAAAQRAAATIAHELPSPPPVAADAAGVAALRAWLAPLRAQLGPARPRQRDGR
ncbi:MAG: hypothetical protein ACK6D1_07350 [Planctomycetota bacterium]